MLVTLSKRLHHVTISKCIFELHTGHKITVDVQLKIKRERTTSETVKWQRTCPLNPSP